MFRNITSFLIAIFLMLPLCALGEYKVVLKKSGKLMEGKYIREDEQYIYLISDGVKVNFKKSLLDLDKMKELNGSENKATPQTNINELKEESDSEHSPLAAAAENARKKKTGNSRIYTDADRSIVSEDERAKKEEKVEKEQPKSPEAAGYLQTIENLDKEIERFEQELMDAKLENQDTRAIEKLLEDTKALRDRRQTEYEEVVNQNPPKSQ
jgi:hypothetical protein